MGYIKVGATGRIMSGSRNFHCGDGEIIVDIPEEIDINRIYEYRYESGKFIHDPPVIVMSKEARIAELKQQLAATDYVVLKIVEGAATWEEYPDIRELRQTWRDKINKLEAMTE